MMTFEYNFVIRAPLAAVAAFHHDTRALKRLTPPPILIQMHKIEPLARNSVAEFTLWFGPLPVRWAAVHANVDPLRGFTDVQASGPMKYWKHIHTFTAESNRVTRVGEHIEYEHHRGWRGLLSRLLFARPALGALFTYRKLATRKSLERQ